MNSEAIVTLVISASFVGTGSALLARRLLARRHVNRVIAQFEREFAAVPLVDEPLAQNRRDTIDNKEQA